MILNYFASESQNNLISYIYVDKVRVILDSASLLYNLCMCESIREPLMHDNIAPSTRACVYVERACACACAYRQASCTCCGVTWPLQCILAMASARRTMDSSWRTVMRHEPPAPPAPPSRCRSTQQYSTSSLPASCTSETFFQNLFYYKQTFFLTTRF